MANVTKNVNFKFYLILINLNLKTGSWLSDTVLDGIGLYSEFFSANVLLYLWKPK